MSLKIQLASWLLRLRLLVQERSGRAGVARWHLAKLKRITVCKMFLDSVFFRA
jgi:hypothetical protein